MVEATSETADDFDMEIPQGWAEVEDPGGPFTFALARSSDASGSQYALTVRWSSLEELRRARWLPASGPAVIDVHDLRDSAMEDAQKVEGITGATARPDREIGGTTATGMAVAGMDGDVHANWQEWFMWRHDGLWEITISPGGQAGQVPAELSRALDTVTWTAPARGSD